MNSDRREQIRLYGASAVGVMVAAPQGTHVDRVACADGRQRYVLTPRPDMTLAELARRMGRHYRTRRAGGVLQIMGVKA